VVLHKAKLIRILRNLNVFHNDYTCDYTTACIVKEFTDGKIDYFTSKPGLIKKKTSSKIARFIVERAFGNTSGSYKD